MSRVAAMAEQNTTNDAIERARTMLRDKGLRCTASRIAVLQHLFAAKAPVSHADLADALVPDGYDRATLYRNLIDLTEKGLALRSDHGDHVWRFELIDGDRAAHDDHLHFVCTDCGAVECVHGVEVKLHGGADARVFLQQRVQSVLLKGVCSACE